MSYPGSVQSSPGLLVRDQFTYAARTAGFRTPQPENRLQNPTSASDLPMPSAVFREESAKVMQTLQPARVIDFQRFVALVLLFAVLVSGITLVWSRHKSRALLQELERLNVEHDELQIEWGNLQLEQATASENSRVEQIATSKLGLGFPEQSRVVVIKQ